MRAFFLFSKKLNYGKNYRHFSYFRGGKWGKTWGKDFRGFSDCKPEIFLIQNFMNSGGREMAKKEKKGTGNQVRYPQGTNQSQNYGDLY